MSAPLRVVFVSVMDLYLDLLLEIISSRGHKLVAVLTCQGYKSRRSDAYLSVIKAIPYGIDIIVSDRPDQYAEILAPYTPIDLLLCAGFPWLLRPSLLNLPRLGCINVHNSKLPKLRGPNAMGWYFRNNEKELILCIHYMDEQFDHGNILDTVSFPIDDNDFPEDLIRKGASCYVQLVNSGFEKIERGEKGTPQEGTPSQAPKFEASYRYVDWNSTARYIHNQIRGHVGMRDIPLGAIATLAGRKAVLIHSQLLVMGDDESIPTRQQDVLPGTILEQDDSHMIVQCFDHPLFIDKWKYEE